MQRFYRALSPASKRTFRPIGVEADLATCLSICELNAANPAERYDLFVWHDDAIVGWGFLWDIRTEKPSLGLGVADTHQRKGVGRALMSALMQWAADQTLPEVHLIAVRDNAPAIRLYQSFGFRITGERHDERDGLWYHEMAWHGRGG